MIRVLIFTLCVVAAALGVASRAREGSLPSRRVIFVHTGGSFGLFPFGGTLLR